jgi:glucans biosynthesis protein C
MSTAAATPAQPGRYFFLDWVRILAFFVLIVYHVGMYYVSWGWHVKSTDAGRGPEPFMLLSAPWRLDLLFLVAGVASGCMLARLAPGRFLRQRSWRLLVPLLFGMFVIVPPQSYFEVVEKLGYGGGYGAFLRLYAGGYHGFCQDGCLVLPTWNHLWFVAYLWTYTAVLALLALALGARFEGVSARLAAAAGDWLAGWKLVLLPAALLALARHLLIARFGETHALVGDWYLHAKYLPMFLFGALLARMPRVWPRIEALRWRCLAQALCGWAVAVLWWALPEDAIGASLMPWILPVMRCIHGLLAWSAILAVCGFARRHLDRDGPARRYLTEAVFPVYILHQTLIVTLAHAFKPLHLAPGLEALVLVVLTATLSFAGFELVRRVAVLRPLFGLGALQRRPAAQGLPLADAA